MATRTLFLSPLFCSHACTWPFTWLYMTIYIHSILTHKNGGFFFKFKIYFCSILFFIYKFSVWYKVKLYQDGFFLMENLQLKQWPEAWFFFFFFPPSPLFSPPQLCDVANFWWLSTWGCSQIWLKTRYESRKV